MRHRYSSSRTLATLVANEMLFKAAFEAALALGNGRIPDAIKESSLRAQVAAARTFFFHYLKNYGNDMDLARFLSLFVEKAPGFSPNPRKNLMRLCEAHASHELTQGEFQRYALMFGAILAIIQEPVSS